MRSPKSCVTSFRYGVSPQPAQAPDDSKSGCSICEPLTVDESIRVRSDSGSFRKNSQLSRSAARCGSLRSMSMALCFATSLLRAGQVSTQIEQPVQSSGRTWMVMSLPLPSQVRLLNCSGAPVCADGS